MSKAGPSRPIKRPLARPIPRQNAPKPSARDDVIVISSDEDEETEGQSPKRPTAPVNTAPVVELPTRNLLSRLTSQRDHAPIIISSSESEAVSKKHTSSDSDKSAKSRSRPRPVVELATPVNHRFKRTPASALGSKLRYTTASSSQPLPALGRPKPFPLARKTVSVPARLEDLPPLPSSSSPPQDHAPSSPSQDPAAYRENTAGPNPSSDVDADSSSSGDIVETVLTTAEQDPMPAMVLDSSPGPGSSGSERVPDASQHRDPDQPTIPSSPTPSQGSDHTEAEQELEEMTANVSLYDASPSKGKAPDSAVAQAVAAVGNVNLGVSSDGGAGSEGSDDRFNCSVGDCQATFTTAGKLHSHTSRDHGIKLQQKSKGKRKARDEDAPIPSKRRVMDAPHPRSRDSSASGSSSDRYVKRKQTVGFNSFVQKVSDQESLSPSDVPDAASSSNSSRSPSPPSTPAPSIPKIRAPHPNMRTVVPDSPSANLSPSKQIAQTKDSILIEGEKLETWRVDLVNSMPESYRRDPGCRAVFEAYMDDAMRENEPCAPAIVVENEVDKEPCPPWEFVYYNRMVYGTNVPKPDMDALVGCDCLGPCNPNNKRCACVQRQERYFAENPGLDEYEGFGCHPSGEIKYHNGAIFGCNSKCSCDADCSNKVLQQGRKYAISVKKTKNKGWGVFAKENIPAGMFIGVYTGELLTEGIVNKRSPVYDEFGRTYVLNIDFAHIRANKDAPTYAVDAFHAGNFTRFFNHSCQPNLGLTAYYCDDVDIQKPLISLFCDRFIKAGEELTFSYTGLDVDDPDDVAKLQQIQHGEHSGKVFEKCLCGAPKCFGIMFTGES